MIRTLTACLIAFASPVLGQTCGANIPDFKAGLLTEAIDRGINRDTAENFLSGLQIDESVLRADRRQGVFQRDFIDFSRRLISNDRLARARQNRDRHANIFATVEANYGIPAEVLLAFWAFETDFGAVQGDFNTANALFTLAHDCRRPELFRPQIIAAMELFSRGDFDPRRTTGAWAGEVGMVQMLPGDIIENGVDGDGDGRVTLKTSPADALMSGGAMLQSFGWTAGQPWLQEVVVPDALDWSQSGLATTRLVEDWAADGVQRRSGALVTGLPASLLLPMGRNGPAFLAYPNFHVYLEWNQSLTYVTTAAYFATRIAGSPAYNANAPDPALSNEQMQELQRRLAARGHDVGGIDGILGAGTRAAVQAEQLRLGFPADAWPTRALLDQL